VVAFAVDYPFQGQAVGRRRQFVGVAHRHGSDRDHPLGQGEHLGDPVGVVGRRAEVADAEPLRLRFETDVLRSEDRVDRAVDEPDEIVVLRVGPPLAAPQREPAHVDAERQHDRGLSDHRLSEMARRQLFPDLRVGRHDDAVYLHIACVGSPRASFQNPLQQGLVHRIRLVAAHRPMLEYRFDHSFLSF